MKALHPTETELIGKWQPVANKIVADDTWEDPNVREAAQQALA